MNSQLALFCFVAAIATSTLGSVEAIDAKANYTATLNKCQANLFSKDPNVVNDDDQKADGAEVVSSFKTCITTAYPSVPASAVTAMMEKFVLSSGTFTLQTMKAIKAVNVTTSKAGFNASCVIQFLAKQLAKVDAEVKFEVPKGEGAAINLCFPVTKLTKAELTSAVDLVNAGLKAQDAAVTNATDTLYNTYILKKTS